MSLGRGSRPSLPSWLAGVPRAPPLTRTGQERHDREHQREREPGDPEPDSRGAQPEDEPRLVAEPARPQRAAPALAPVRPDGRGLRLREGVRDPRPRRAEARPDRADEHLAGLVALRLRPLRPAVHPHELARRRHLPDRRRARRRRPGGSALRSPQQLARQREPRQGAPAAVADQAEVRPQDLLGRPARLHRQRRDGVDGLSDVRLRLRPRGHLGGRGDLLGQRGHLARRRALQRGARARQTARRRADGSDLRQPRGSGRRPRPAGLGEGHPRHVRAHGDERRRDARADRRRAHVRQDPRRRRPRQYRPRARGGSAGGAGTRLEEQRGQRQGRRRDHQRARGRVDEGADEVGQRLPREPVRVRLGADHEPGRSEAVDPEERRRGRAPFRTPTTPPSGTRR